MARFSTLYSSSKGNCIFIAGSGGAILIDAGVSAKKIENAIFEIGEDIRNVHAIFVTHEHSDHVNGLRIIASKYSLRVYSSRGTIDALDESEKFNGIFKCVMPENGVTEADMHISAFRTTHDCREGLGYIIQTADDRKIAVATDLGYYSDEIKNALTGCDLAFIESNYDEKMLRCGPYPQHLKARIVSKHGHLSNDECASAAEGLLKCGTTRFILGHLSAENNLPELAHSASLSSLCKAGGVEGKDFTLCVAPRLSPMKKIIF